MYDRHNIMSFYYLIENDDIILNRFVISSFTRISKSTIFFHWLADNNQIFNIELQHRAKWYTYYVRKKHIFSSLCLQSICFEFHGNAYFSTVKVHQLIFHLHNEIHVNYFCLSNSSLSILTRINDFQKKRSSDWQNTRSFSVYGEEKEENYSHSKLCELIASQLNSTMCDYANLFPLYVCDVRVFSHLHIQNGRRSACQLFHCFFSVFGVGECDWHDCVCSLGAADNLLANIIGWEVTLLQFPGDLHGYDKCERVIDRVGCGTWTHTHELLMIFNNFL